MEMAIQQQPGGIRVVIVRPGFCPEAHSMRQTWPHSRELRKGAGDQLQSQGNRIKISGTKDG